jgi:hypothetical protein
MTREDAESRVWSMWRHASDLGLGCETRVDPARTEEYEWGWVVFLSPVRPMVCRRLYPYDRYAIERRAGDSFPVGTKGLEYTLVQLGVVTEADWRGRSQDEVRAMWDRLTKRCSGPA